MINLIFVSQSLKSSYFKYLEFFFNNINFMRFDLDILTQ